MLDARRVLPLAAAAPRAAAAPDQECEWPPACVQAGLAAVGVTTSLPLPRRSPLPPRTGRLQAAPSPHRHMLRQPCLVCSWSAICALMLSQSTSCRHSARQASLPCCFLRRCCRSAASPVSALPLHHPGPCVTAGLLFILQTGGKEKASRIQNQCCSALAPMSEWQHAQACPACLRGDLGCVPHHWQTLRVFHALPPAQLLQVAAHCGLGFSGGRWCCRQQQPPGAGLRPERQSLWAEAPGCNAPRCIVLPHTTPKHPACKSVVDLATPSLRAWMGAAGGGGARCLCQAGTVSRRVVCTSVRPLQRQ